MAVLNISRRRRGVAVSSITHLEKHVSKLEPRKSFHKDEVAIKGFIKRLENLDADFKGYHCSVVELYPIYTSAISRLRVGFCFKPVVLLTGFKCVYTTVHA